MSNSLWIKDKVSRAVLAVDREAKTKFLAERNKEARIIELENRIEVLERQVKVLSKLISQLLD